VCFDTGGIVDLVEPTGAGVVVPYPYAAAMADALAGLLEDPEARRRAGEAGATAVASGYLTPQLAPQVLEVIERTRGR